MDNINKIAKLVAEIILYADHEYTIHFNIQNMTLEYDAIVIEKTNQMSNILNYYLNDQFNNIKYEYTLTDHPNDCNNIYTYLKDYNGTTVDFIKENLNELNDLFLHLQWESVIFPDHTHIETNLVHPHIWNSPNFIFTATNPKGITMKDLMTVWTKFNIQCKLEIEWFNTMFLDSIDFTNNNNTNIVIINITPNPK